MKTTKRIDGSVVMKQNTLNKSYQLSEKIWHKFS